MNNTHGIGPVLLPDVSTAFIDGIPDTCDHKGPRDDYMESASGKQIFWHTYRQWAHYTAPMRNELIYQHHADIDDTIVFHSSVCRKCGKIDGPNYWE